jgi:hypothetical protein
VTSRSRRYSSTYLNAVQLHHQPLHHQLPLNQLPQSQQLPNQQLLSQPLPNQLPLNQPQLNQQLLNQLLLSQQLPNQPPLSQPQLHQPLQNQPNQQFKLPAHHVNVVKHQHQLAERDATKSHAQHACHAQPPLNQPPQSQPLPNQLNQQYKSPAHHASAVKYQNQSTERDATKSHAQPACHAQPLPSQPPLSQPPLHQLLQNQLNQQFKLPAHHANAVKHHQSTERDATKFLAQHACHAQPLPSQLLQSQLPLSQPNQLFKSPAHHASVVKYQLQLTERDATKSHAQHACHAQLPLNQQLLHQPLLSQPPLLQLLQNQLNQLFKSLAHHAHVVK